MQRKSGWGGGGSSASPRRHAHQVDRSRVLLPHRRAAARLGAAGSGCCSAVATPARRRSCITAEWRGRCRVGNAAVAHQVEVGCARRDDPERGRVPVQARRRRRRATRGARSSRTRSLVLAAHLPLSLFALQTLRPSFFRLWDERGRLLLQFLHCWTWPNLIFWALVPNHNVRYALPISPGLMGLGCHGVDLAWWRQEAVAAPLDVESLGAGGADVNPQRTFLSLRPLPQED